MTLQCDLEHLMVKTTLYTQSTYLQGPNFGLFHSTTSHFPDTRFYKIGKIGNAPNDLECLTVKSTLHKLGNFLQGPDFRLFCSATSHFHDIAHFIIPHGLPC